ncbi:MAG: serine/threonine-protein phosphatase [Chitinispirillales bacterium]|jgi:serine phosphatase RsbU (regulator of sigma subunit)|nr:serine/threonine-protein phosphatase [Chitinispirillales bacterium]
MDLTSNFEPYAEMDLSSGFKPYAEKEVIPHLDLRVQNELLKSQLINASLINELTKVLHSSTDLKSITKTALLSFQDFLDFDRAVLFAINRKKFRLEPRDWIGIDDAAARKFSITLGFDGGEITDAIFLNKHIFVEEPDPDDDCFSLDLNSSSYLLIPLLNKPNRKCREIKGCGKKSCQCYDGINPYCWSVSNEGAEEQTSEDERRKNCLSCAAFKAEGVFWLDRNITKKPITSDDIATLTSIINLVGLITENIRMMNSLDAANQDLKNVNERLRTVNHELQDAQAKIRQDLEQASAIQQKLLPHDIKSSKDYSVSSHYSSANTVGGDYFDLFKITEKTYGLIMADVSGHGIASSLIMSMVKILLKTYSANETSPKKTLDHINQVFIEEIATSHFVTIFYAVFDVEKKEIKYTSAGHCPSIYINKKTEECTLLKADGLFLGVFPDMMLSEKKLDYIPGEHRLILYTDGLTEAVNPDNKMYGTEKLTVTAGKTSNLTPKNAIEAILEDQKIFCNSMPPEDDTTLLIIDF